jgi:6,7-dimethyl-8-ribityllumazine synthase
MATTSNGEPTPVSYTGVRSHESSRIAIVTARWHADICERLRTGCEDALREAGVKGIVSVHVPGAFELPQAAAHLLSSHRLDAVICLGCVLTGETKHNVYLSQALASGITSLAMTARKPVIFGVLTPDTVEQALARAGGAHGHKGREAAVAALEMIDLWQTSKDAVKAADTEIASGQRIGF